MTKPLRLPKPTPAMKAPFGVPLLCANRYEGRTFYFVAVRSPGPVPGEGYPPNADLSSWAVRPSGASVDRPDVCWELPA